MNYLKIFRQSVQTVALFGLFTVFISTTPGQDTKINEICSNPGFNGGKSVALAGSAGIITSGDFNNDGKRDVAATFNGNANTHIEIQFGDGNGNFTSAGMFSTPDYISNMITTDFNGDGNIDLVITNRNTTASDRVTLYSGDGAGHFNYAYTIGLESAPSFIAAGDFNGDDRIDFAATIAVQNKVVIYYADGSGNYVQNGNYSVGPGPASISKADFNNDGRTDLVITVNNSPAIFLMLGAPNGGFF